jgi:hypothetical protein
VTALGARGARLVERLPRRTATGPPGALRHVIRI